MTKRARATTPAETEQPAPRRGALTAESARAIAKASLASGFPVPAQHIELLGGEAAIAALEAELAAEAAAATPADDTATPAAGGETTEG